MDPIAGIDVAGDSSFALLLEAQARGHEIFHFEPDALAARDGKVFARGHTLSVRDEPGNHFSLTDERREDLGGLHVLHMRQDPPFDMHYVTATHLLERIHPKTLVVNDPVEVRNAPEKLFTLDFPQFAPPTLITRDPEEIKAFRREFGDIVLKPLYGNGGAGVFRLPERDRNLNSLLEMFESAFREAFIAQRYLPDVQKGDKRIILVDGVAAGAINRVPAEGENRSNMHVGGRAEPIGMTRRDHEICEALGPELKRRGLILVGIDVIGDHLTEINVTSPTGIREIGKFGGEDVAAMVWDAIEARL